MNDNGATPQILEKARKLIVRQPPFQSEELRLILDAAEHISRSEPISHTDSRILRCADRLGPLYAEREPKPPTPLDSRVEEAIVEEAKARATWEAADAARFDLCVDVAGLTGDGYILLRGRRGAVTVATARGRGGERAERRLIEAAEKSAQAGQERLDNAHEVFRRARVARNELEHARSRWRAVASVAESE